MDIIKELYNNKDNILTDEELKDYKFNVLQVYT